MTKLKDVVRGVEVKEFDKEPDYTSYSDGVVVGNNSLASAEVEVNREELRGITAQGYCTDRNSHKVLDPDLLEDIAQAIATAIESGAIIRIKKEG